jgi:hypothetical protein
MAHEIGHLVYNRAKHLDQMLWNLMCGGDGGESRVDLALGQRKAINISPASYNFDETW